VHAVVEEIRAIPGAGPVDSLELELEDFASIRQSAASFLAQGLPLHILVNNAGLAGSRAGLSRSGFEIAFGVNHVGTFLFTTLLLDRIRASAPARIVTVSYRAPGIDWDAVRRPKTTFTGLQEYGVSKLANVVFSTELSRRLQGTGVTTYALHPGAVATDVWRHVPWPFRSVVKYVTLTPEQGAEAPLYCAVDPGVAWESGLYYDTCRQKTPSVPAQSPELAAELWRRSEAWTSI
jgi:dehydrogenase/reductase SDR family protein 13